MLGDTDSLSDWGATDDGTGSRPGSAAPSPDRRPSASRPFARAWDPTLHTSRCAVFSPAIIARGSGRSASCVQLASSFADLACDPLRKLSSPSVPRLLHHLSKRACAMMRRRRSTAAVTVCQHACRSHQSCCREDSAAGRQTGRSASTVFPEQRAARAAAARSRRACLPRGVPPPAVIRLPPGRPALPAAGARQVHHRAHPGRAGARLASPLSLRIIGAYLCAMKSSE